MWQTAAMGNGKVSPTLRRAIAFAVVVVERQRSLGLTVKEYTIKYYRGYSNNT